MRACIFFLKRFRPLTGVVGSLGLFWVNFNGPFNYGFSIRSSFSPLGVGLFSLVRKLLRVDMFETDVLM